MKTLAEIADYFEQRAREKSALWRLDKDIEALECLSRLMDPINKIKALVCSVYFDEHLEKLKRLTSSDSIRRQYVQIALDIRQVI